MNDINNGKPPIINIMNHFFGKTGKNIDFSAIVDSVNIEIEKAKKQTMPFTHKLCENARNEMRIVDSQLILDSIDLDPEDYIAKATNTAKLTEIFNNLAHYYKKVQNYDESATFFGAKVMMIRQLVIDQSKYKADGNQSHIISGILEEQGMNPFFLMDIPTIGQVSWHITPAQKEKFEKIGVDKYSYDILLSDDSPVSNKNILLENLNTRQLNEHLKIVVMGDPSKIKDSLDMLYNIKEDETKIQKNIGIKEQLGDIFKGKSLTKESTKVLFNLLEPEEKER